MLPEFSNNRVSSSRRRFSLRIWRAVAGNDLHTMSSELVDWPGKIAANLKLIEEAFEPQKLISVELVMMIHTHLPAKSLKAV